MNILITGGAGTLGYRLSEQLRKRGHEIFIMDVKEEKDLMADKTIFAGYFTCDLADPVGLENCFGVLLSAAGKIDVLINNASLRQFRNLDEFSSAEIRRNLQVDLVSPILLSRLVLPSMKANKFGRIINISSVSAFKGYSSGSLYCTGKNALNTFTESLSSELNYPNQGITVNSICPGSFSKTDGSVIKGGEYVIKKVLGITDHIINSGVNGKVFPAFPYSLRVRTSGLWLLKAMKNLIPG